MDTKKALLYFKQQFQKHTDPKRAKYAKQYLKSPYKFYGLDTATKRDILKAYLKDNPNTTVDQAVKLAKKLWASPFHDDKTLSVMLLHYFNKKLTKKHLPFLEQMANQANNWDHLDSIAVHLIGQLITNDPQVIKKLPVWAKSKNFWVRRTALLAQLLHFRKKQGDKKLFIKLAVPMLKEKASWSKEEKFFIRKAIGWVLREIAQQQPQITFNFVKQYKSQMSGLTYKEATRKLPVKMQNKLKKL